MASWHTSQLGLVVKYARTEARMSLSSWSFFDVRDWHIRGLFHFYVYYFCIYMSEPELQTYIFQFNVTKGLNWECSNAPNNKLSKQSVEQSSETNSRNNSHEISFLYFIFDMAFHCWQLLLLFFLLLLAQLKIHFTFRYAIAKLSQEKDNMAFFDARYRITFVRKENWILLSVDL